MYDESPKEYKALEDAMHKKIIAIKGAGKIAKESAKEMSRKEDKDARLKCKIATKLFYEGMDMYEGGQMTYGEFVEDLHKCLLAVDGGDK